MQLSLNRTSEWILCNIDFEIDHSNCVYAEPREEGPCYTHSIEPMYNLYTLRPWQLPLNGAIFVSHSSYMQCLEEFSLGFSFCLGVSGFESSVLKNTNSALNSILPFSFAFYSSPLIKSRFRPTPLPSFPLYSIYPPFILPLVTTHTCLLKKRNSPLIMGTAR